MDNENNENESLQYSPPGETKSSRRHRPTQLIMVSIFGVSFMCCGMSLGHSAVLLPELQKNESGIHIDDNTASLIASVYAMVGPLGALTTGIVMELWGRRKSSITANVGFVIGWILLSAAQNSTVIVYARAIEGFFRTSLFTVLPVHLDEITDPLYRGTAFSFHHVLLFIGMLVMSSCGALLQWRTVCIISTLISGVTIFLFFLCLESPSWLVRKNRIKDAEKCLLKLWGPGLENKAKEELTNMKIRYLADFPNRNRMTTKHCYKNSFKIFKILFKPHVFKPFIIMHIFSTFQIFCGQNLITYYSIDVISRTKREKRIGIDPYVINIFISSIRLITQVAAFLCMFKMGRRPIALISGIGSTFSFIALSLILFLRENNSSPINPWIEELIDIFLLLIYMGFNTFGFFILSNVMLGETQNSHIRSFVTAYFFTVNDLLLGVLLKNYYFILEIMKLHGMILFFGVSCLLCTVFVFLFLPETQGKSLEEIEDYFLQSNILWFSRKKGEVEITEIQYKSTFSK